jgi:hypothetical protein
LLAFNFTKFARIYLLTLEPNISGRRQKRIIRKLFEFHRRFFVKPNPKKTPPQETPFEDILHKGKVFLRRVISQKLITRKYILND